MRGKEVSAKMSLRNIFPSGVLEISLSYLSYPELLVCESISGEVIRVLKFSPFWCQRLEDEYGLPSKEIAELKDSRAQYRHLFIKETISKGRLFTLGQIGVSLTKNGEFLIHDLREEVSNFETISLMEKHGKCKIVYQTFERGGSLTATFITMMLGGY